MQLPSMLYAGFKIWMVWDAMQRQPGTYWWVICLLPGGGLFYFFAKWLPRRKGRGGGAAPRLGLKELEIAHERTPSFSNRMALANALHDRGEHERAVDLYELALKQSDDDRDCLNGLAQSLIALDRHERAAEALRVIIEQDITWLECQPAFDLAHCLWALDRREEALEVLQRAVRRTGNLGPCTKLAGRLIELGRGEEALPRLKRALEDYETSPKFVKVRDRRFLRDAKALLRG